MKNMRRMALAMMAASAITMGMTGCGKQAPAPDMTTTYTGNAYNLIDAVGWYVSDAYTLELRADNTYELEYRTDMFGAEDMESKGVRTIIYTGTYTTAAAEDGEPSHQDVTLAAPGRMYLEQHGKGWGRNADVVLGTVKLDSANWTEYMTTIYDSENNAAKGEDFLAKYAHEMKVTVEDPTVDLEDTTLSFRLVTLPELNLDAE